MCVRREKHDCVAYVYSKLELAYNLSCFALCQPQAVPGLRQAAFANLAARDCCIRPCEFEARLLQARRFQRDSVVATQDDLGTQAVAWGKHYRGSVGSSVLKRRFFSGHINLLLNLTG